MNVEEAIRIIKNYIYIYEMSIKGINFNKDKQLTITSQENAINVAFEMLNTLTGGKYHWKRIIDDAGIVQSFMIQLKSNQIIVLSDNLA